MVEHIFRSENDSHSLTRGIEDMCALMPKDWYGTLHEEIVRCMDCKNFEPYGESSEVYPDRYWCDKLTIFMPSDGFCSFGKRMG